VEKFSQPLTGAAVRQLDRIGTNFGVAGVLRQRHRLDQQAKRPDGRNVRFSHP
jgi:hypothetical protein